MAMSDVGALLESEGASAGEEDGDEREATPLWQSAVLFALAVLVIQGQVFFVSCAINLGLRHLILPKGIAYEKEFQPDYQQPNPVAYVPILEDNYLTSGQLLHKLEDARGLLVQDGSYFDVWLKLSLPYSSTNENLFQVQVDLLALNSTTVFTARRACLMRRQNSLLRHAKLVAFAPLYVLGLLKDGEETLYFRVVSKFRQGSITGVGDTKVSQLRVSLLPQRGRDPPEVYGAAAHVLVKLSYLQHFLYHYPVTSFVTLSCGLAVGLNVLLLGIIVAIVLAFLFGGPALEQDDGDGEGASGVTSDEDEEGGSSPKGQAAGSGKGGSEQGDRDEETTSGLTNVDFEGGAGGRKESSAGEQGEGEQSTAWGTSASDASAGAPGNESDAQVLKKGSKKFITETQARRRA